MNEIASERRASVSENGKKALKHIDKLPSLSNVVGEFLEMSKKEFVSGRDFERVISKDQALVSRLLKVANSSMYGMSGGINSITDAIVMIGLEEVKKIVYSVSSEGLIRRNFKNYRYPDKGFWLHSMGVAITCCAINEKAGSTGLGDEQAFIAGLVHDAGKLIIDEFLSPEAGPHGVSLEEEVAAVGMDHSELGEAIMKRWSIPDSIAEAVRYHHKPADSAEVPSDAMLVFIADGICNQWGVGNQPFMELGEEIDLEQFGEGLDLLQLSAPGMESILWDIRQKLAGLERLYET